MATSNSPRVELLNRDNYDTWKIQVEAILVKNDEWEYVSGSKTRPDIVDSDNESKLAAERWDSKDRKAKSDIILCMSPSELKQVKSCITSRDVWMRLKSIYQSRGPARKATLLKRLTQHKMADGEDMHDHVRCFFDTVDKLTEMEVDMNPDLLAILLLYSLPSNFENFRCAIESRDELPTPEALRVKIVEESNARRAETRNSKCHDREKATGKMAEFQKEGQRYRDGGRGNIPVPMLSVQEDRTRVVTLNVLFC